MHIKKESFFFILYFLSIMYVSSVNIKLVVNAPGASILSASL